MIEQPRQMSHFELSNEQAEKLMIRRIEEGLQKEGKAPRYAALAVLVDEDGKTFIGRRLTAPHVGLFSVIGGKIELSPFGQENKGSLYMKMNEDGLENPKSAVLREVAEEVYPALLSVSEEEMIKIFQPKRQAIVYDVDQNAYCFLYQLRKPVSEHLYLSPRELEEIQPASEIPHDAINPLTRFFLSQMDSKRDWHIDFPHGPIQHMMLPRDIPSFATSGALSLSMTLHEPGFLIANAKTEPMYAYAEKVRNTK